MITEPDSYYDISDNSDLSPPHGKTFDRITRQLIEILKNEAKSIAELAPMINLSTAATRARINKLRKKGLIKRKLSTNDARVILYYLK